jgi:hypothetical protein
MTSHRTSGSRFRRLAAYGLLISSRRGELGLVRWLGGPIAWTEDWDRPRDSPRRSPISPPDAPTMVRSARRRLRARPLDGLAPPGSLALGTARLRRREFERAHRAFGAAETGGGPLGAFARWGARRRLGLGKSREAAELIERAAASAKDPVLADDLAVARARSLRGGRQEARSRVDREAARLRRVPRPGAHARGGGPDCG